MKNLKLFLLAVILLPAVPSLSQTIIQQPPVRKIVVNGSAEMEVVPDEVYVNFVLKEYDDTRKVKVGIDAIKKEFLTACEKTGIPKENIAVEGVSGSAFENWYIRKRKKEPDFKATITYIIKFSTSKMLDDLIPKLNDEAVANMYISRKQHSLMESYRKQTKINATKAAKEKAEYLAASVGEKVGKTLLLEEIETGGPYPMMMKSNMAMDMESGQEPYGGETSLPFEKIKIRYETRAEFELQ